MDLLKDPPVLRPRDAEKVKGALGNWVKLCRVLSSFTDEELRAALCFEVAGKRRKDIAHRLHVRIARRKFREERRELHEALNTPRP